MQDIKKTIKTRIGETFKLTLDSNMTTGHQWKITEPINFKILQELGYTYKTPRRAAPGTGGVEIWEFKAIGKGTTELEMRYIRIWEGITPSSKAAAFKIIVE